MTRRVVLCVVAVIILSGAWVAWTALRPHDASRPNVILVVIDTLRRDRLSAYGGKRAFMPNLDALASDNVVFVNAYSNSNWTKPAVASLFTGLYVSQHGVKYVVTGQGGELPVTQRLPDDAVTLAEVMKGAGYYTLGVVENVHVSRKLGFAQGFECWDERPYGATNVTNGFLEHLDETREARGERPLFAYVHYFDPHAPYYRTRYFETEGAIVPGLSESKSADLKWTNYTFGVDSGIVGMSPIERRRLEDLYDGEVRNVDTNLGRLIAGLKERGLYDDTWLIITADHGENFGEKGRLTHPHDCFANPQVAVPLVMRLPRSMGPKEMAVTDRVEHIDLTRTLVSFSGTAALPGMAGRDLVPALSDNQPLPARNVLCESESGGMLLASKFKYVAVPTEFGAFQFLYDGAADPLEEHNLKDIDDKTAASLSIAMSEAVETAKLARTVQAAPAVPLTPEELEQLKALGYLH